ncbi:MAG: N-formylglutamate amidohydrolase, partial [Planctomycetota bacterium]
MPRSLVVTCEHGGNRVPPRFLRLFRGRRALLASHRGWDRGALNLARGVARALHAPLFASTTTRLLVDLNRSPGHPRLHAPFVPRRERDAIVRRHYRPYRGAVESAIAARRRVLHLSVHTFTPVLRGRARDVDIGLLFDPSRAPERRLCARWRGLLRAARPDLRVRRNSPYRGVSDGFTTRLRRRFPARRYLGVELE